MANLAKDLIILVADLDMENTLRGLLSKRQKALEVRPITYDIYPHIQHDPGCRTGSVDFLRSFVGRYEHALVLFDHAGSGGEARTVEELQDDLENQLRRNGWGNHARVVVIDPELEIWVWSNSQQVDVCLGWVHIVLLWEICERNCGRRNTFHLHPPSPKHPKRLWAGLYVRLKKPDQLQYIGSLPNRCHSISVLTQVLSD
ncbi:MAG: hypothetical protein ACYDBJ_13875 [Aggregatilineales bacterium]